MHVFVDLIAAAIYAIETEEGWCKYCSIAAYILALPALAQEAKEGRGGGGGPKQRCK